MSMTVIVSTGAQETPEESGEILLYANVCNDAWALLPLEEERYGFYRVLNRSGYPWRAITTLHYLRGNVDAFYAQPQNAIVGERKPNPAFYTLPSDTLCTVDMWDSS